MRAHDLLWLCPGAGADGASLPDWVEPAWPVVVRRAPPVAQGLIPVGLRGRTRNQRRAAWVAPAQVLLAPEDRICVTMLEMLNVEGIVLEPAGALSVDVLPELATQIAGRTVVCVTSGGNFDFERLPEVKERAQRYSGVKKYFILRMPQRPGALKEFLSMLGPEDDIARFEYLKKSARNFGSVLIGIETTEAQNFTSLLFKLNKAGFTYRDITSDEVLSEFLI